MRFYRFQQFDARAVARLASDCRGGGTEQLATPWAGLGVSELNDGGGPERADQRGVLHALKPVRRSARAAPRWSAPAIGQVHAPCTDERVERPRLISTGTRYNDICTASRSWNRRGHRPRRTPTSRQAAPRGSHPQTTLSSDSPAAAQERTHLGPGRRPRITRRRGPSSRCPASVGEVIAAASVAQDHTDRREEKRQAAWEQSQINPPRRVCGGTSSR